MKIETDVWYVAALDWEVGPALLGRTIANKDVLLFRQTSGEVAAIEDTCPHRLAPLSLGKQIGDVVQCPYHGLEFDGKGRCVHNPQSSLIAPNAHVASYPVVERHSFIWVWLGDPELANPELIPDLSPYATNETQIMGTQHLPSEYRYDILIDNLLDFSHVSYVHHGSFASGVGVRQENEVKTVGDVVHAKLLRFNSPAPPRDKDLGDYVDEKYIAIWYPGQIVASVKSTVAAGGDFDIGRKTVFGNIATPADAANTHYFLYATRFHDLDDPAVTEQLRAYQRRVVSLEDGPMLEAVHRRMKGRELLDFKPVVLPADGAAMRVRRIMARRLDEEAKRSSVARERLAV